MTTVQQPLLGDIVHVVFGGRTWAAIVTHVHPTPPAIIVDSLPTPTSTINCFVFPDADHPFGVASQQRAVKYDSAGVADKTWHWPEQPALTETQLEAAALDDFEAAAVVDDDPRLSEPPRRLGARLTGRMSNWRR